METKKMAVELTETQLKVLKMRYSGLRIGEIAKRLDTSSANVSKVLKQARRKISGVKKTIEVLRILGIAKDGAEIEFTDKGRELFVKWRRSHSISREPLRVIRQIPRVSTARQQHLEYYLPTDYIVRERREEYPSSETFIKEIELPLRKIIQEQLEQLLPKVFEKLEESPASSKKKPTTIYS